MESYNEILSVLNSITNMSTENLQKLLDILRIKYKSDVDMHFVIQTLPSLIMKLKIYISFAKNQDKQIIDEINNLIKNVIPLFDAYFKEKNFDVKQQNAYLAFCKILALN